MSEHQVTEAEIDEAVARAFGRTPSTSIDLFKRAGFCDTDAQVGARLMESGNYLSFADVATSMGMFDGFEFRRRNPDVNADRIAEVAKSVEAAKHQVQG